MQFVIISDIHANYAALEAVSNWVDKQKKEIYYWFLGDLVGYGPAKDARRCIRWLKERLANQENEDTTFKNQWIPGNHDEWMVDPQGEIALDATVSIFSQRIWLERPECKDDWAWFKDQVLRSISSKHQYNNTVISTDAAREYVMVHGSLMESAARVAYLDFQRENLFILEMERLKQMTQQQSACLFFGHTHFPIAAFADQDQRPVFCSIKYGQAIPLSGGLMAINPGSVGQPRDNNPKASFAVLDTDKSTITFQRIEYEIGKTIGSLNEERIDLQHQILLASTLEQKKIPLKVDEGGKVREFVNYRSLTDDTYRNLVRRLQTADGGEKMQNYFAKIYHQSKYDLVAKRDDQLLW